MQDPVDDAELIQSQSLCAFSSGILEQIGVPSADAALIGDSLVQADEWGHQSHGVLRLPWYVARLESGAMSKTSRPTTVLDSGALSILDGNAGIGQVLADTARSAAVARAKEFGVGVVGVRNSNHFGTAMYFTRRAAAQGCVAILTTNASPAMAPWGGKDKIIGTNPWSIAAPFGNNAVALDIANTAVARGKMYLAKQQGVQIPDSWAITSEGASTTDPSEAIDGVILPMAGHKGYAISFMMDVLSGALTGSEMGRGVHGPYEPQAHGGAGHLFIAIDVQRAGGLSAFNDRMDAFVSEVKGTSLAQGFDSVFYPGEIEDLNSASAKGLGGVTLPKQTIRDLTSLGAKYGVTL